MNYEKQQREEVLNIILLCETRMIELEQTIRSTSDMGVKKLAQITYQLNKGIHAKYSKMYKLMCL